MAPMVLAKSAAIVAAVKLREDLRRSQEFLFAEAAPLFPVWTLEVVDTEQSLVSFDR